MKDIPIVSLRLVRERTVEYGVENLIHSEDVFELFHSLIGDLDRESVWIVCLDSKSKLSCLSQVSLGTLSSCSMEPREIFKAALLSNAASIITVHNHPSGNPEPSREDFYVTRRILRAARILGIRYHDHIIIGEGRYYSFADQGKVFGMPE